MAIFNVDATGADAVMTAVGVEQAIRDLAIGNLTVEGAFDPTIILSTVETPSVVDRDDADLFVLTSEGNILVVSPSADARDLTAVVGTVGSDVVITHDNLGDYYLGGGDDYFFDDGNGSTLVVGGDGADSITIRGDQGYPLDFRDILDPPGPQVVFNYASGGDGDDFIVDAGAGRTYLSGDEGSDTLFAGLGGDSVLAGSGDDLVVVYSGNADVSGGADDDFIYDLGAGDSTLYGDDGADTIFAGYGSDTVNGGSGDDLIAVFGDSISDTVVGGDGVDTLVVLRATSELASVTDVVGGATTLTFTDFSTLTYAGIESVIFAS